MSANFFKNFFPGQAGQVFHEKNELLRGMSPGRNGLRTQCLFNLRRVGSGRSSGWTGGSDFGGHHHLVRTELVTGVVPVGQDGSEFGRKVCSICAELVTGEVPVGQVAPNSDAMSVQSAQNCGQTAGWTDGSVFPKGRRSWRPDSSLYHFSNRKRRAEAFSCT